MTRLPPWIRIRLHTDGRYTAVNKALGAAALHTVCESAHCPNKQECFNRGTATFMILGNICTRQCRFCAVNSGTPPFPPDPDEPRRIADLAARFGIRHVVVTSVTRDDLPDGGAGAFAETITRIKALPGITVEVLTPDFQGNIHSINTVLSAAPDVFNHNLETVERLQPAIRPQADYRRSLSVLHTASRAGIRPRVKSGLMVGLGETDDELMVALADLRSAGCRSLTLGQYLAPSPRHWPVARFVPPERFEHYHRRALGLGFLAVAAGPLVRSSYQADKLMATHQQNSQSQAPDSMAKQLMRPNEKQSGCETL